MTPREKNFRKRLPERRPSMIRDIVWGNHSFAVTIGFDPATGDVAELFYADGLKSGAELRHTIEDACVAISVALQHGVPIAALSKSLGQVPNLDPLTARAQPTLPASPIGALIATAAAEASRVAAGVDAARQSATATNADIVPLAAGKTFHGGDV